MAELDDVVLEDGQEAAAVLDELGINLPQAEEAEEPQQRAQPEPVENEDEKRERVERYRVRQEAKNNELAQIKAELQRTQQLIAQAQQARQPPRQAPEPPRFEGIPDELQQFMQATIQAENQRLYQAQQAQLAPILNRLQAEEQRQQAALQAQQQQSRFQQMDQEILSDVRSYAAENPDFGARYAVYEEAMYDGLLATGASPQEAADLVAGNGYGMALMARQRGVSVGFFADEMVKAFIAKAGGMVRQTRQRNEVASTQRAARQLAPVSPTPNRRSGARETVGDVVRSGKFDRQDAAKIYRAVGSSKFASVIANAAAMAEQEG